MIRPTALNVHEAWLGRKKFAAAFLDLPQSAGCRVPPQLSYKSAPNHPSSFRDRAKRGARNPEQSGFPAFLDSGFAPSARPGMTVEFSGRTFR
jgi:hypothetical protein